jgi:hypothetical protein
MSLNTRNARDRIASSKAYGLASRITIPCPFCAAPGFLTYELMALGPALERGGICPECGRGAKAIFDRDTAVCGYELVQTCGPDAPAWMPRPFRRLC